MKNERRHMKVLIEFLCLFKGNYLSKAISLLYNSSILQCHFTPIIQGQFIPVPSQESNRPGISI
jgi:hypothetical protein